jgi:alkyl hydroperoxide reductase subunit AhpC
MIELGELERRHDDFARRNTQVVVASLEEKDEALKTQKEFPHLIVVADAKRGLTDAVKVFHPNAGPSGEDAAEPTTFYIDGQGRVRALNRPGYVISRESPDDVLATLDAEIK